MFLHTVFAHTLNVLYLLSTIRNSHSNRIALDFRSDCRKKIGRFGIYSSPYNGMARLYSESSNCICSNIIYFFPPLLPFHSLDELLKSLQLFKSENVEHPMCWQMEKIISFFSIFHPGNISVFYRCCRRHLAIT